MTPQQLIDLNNERLQRINAPFDPVTGLGAPGQRVRVEIPYFTIPVQWLPVQCAKSPLVKMMQKAKSYGEFFSHPKLKKLNPDPNSLINIFTRLRCLHDFPFWAAAFAYIKPKGGGPDIKFSLNRPQRLLIETLEEQRTAGQPIRLILLKARQWGGSTAIQLYMAWLQIVHQQGLNSLIIGHVKDASTEVRDMFHRLMNGYPDSLLDPTLPKIEGVGGMQNIQRIPARNCKIKIGTAEAPDSCRGGDYNLVHCTEVAFWKKTEGKSPEEIIRSACAGVLLKPYTMIIYESTANGVGNFFHSEYIAATKGESQFNPFFISWFDIDQYSIPFSDDSARLDFARHLIDIADQVDSTSDRRDPGRYLWWLWEKGATLEAINWYICERAKYSDHSAIAAEYPSDDIEAFVNTGANVFDEYLVKDLEYSCRKPSFVGELSAPKNDGPECLRDISFIQSPSGLLNVWSKPEPDTEKEIVANRYLVVVDIGGRSRKADWSVVAVFDRLPMLDSQPPVIVAQWRGHCDIDQLAWRAAQIAAWYNNALLVIESNTAESRDPNRILEGDQSQYILSQIAAAYPNLYARRRSEEEIIQGLPTKYGFHTNVATKPMVISTLIRAVRLRLWVERDIECLNELRQYERRRNGSFAAVVGHHDDILMTRAIGLHICFHDMPQPEIVAIERNRPPTRNFSSPAII